MAASDQRRGAATGGAERRSPRRWRPRELHDWGYAWHREDDGRSTGEEIVRGVEAAQAGGWRCVGAVSGA